MTIRLSELYGPVPQGEGAMLGVPMPFIRVAGCNLSCSWCLGPNTMVNLASGGKKRIKDIAVGDVLVGYDEASGTIQETTVTQTATHESDDLYTVVFGGTDHTRHTVNATGEHRFMTTHGWVAVRDMQPGDIVLTAHDYALTAWYKRRDNPMRRPDVAAQVGAFQRRFWTQDKRDAQRERQRAIPGHRLKMLGDRNPMKDPATVAKQVATRSDWKPSTIELRVKRLVEEQGLPYQHCVMSVRAGRRYPDFVIPGTTKAVEVYWPSYMHREATGYVEQVMLDYHACGWEVLPLAVQPGVTDAEIVQKLTTYALNGTPVKAVYRTTVKGYASMENDHRVYDITCAPHPTFFANGLLTHNCDSKYTWEKGYAYTEMSVEDVVDAVGRILGGCRWVSVTGGEPTIYGAELGKLLGRLYERLRAHVIVETNGLRVVPGLQASHVFVSCSPKLPTSGQDTPARRAKVAQFVQWRHLYSARATQYKFVIASPDDLAALPTYCEDVGIDLSGAPNASPVYVQPDGYVQPLDKYLEQLAWLQREAPATVRVTPQVHRLIHGPDARTV